MAGVYLFLVSGQQDSVFDLTITPAGGPAVPTMLTSAGSSSGMALGAAALDMSAALDAMTANPILPQSGEDPISSATAPDATFFTVYLPTMIHQ